MKRETIVNTLVLLGWAPRMVIYGVPSIIPADAHSSYVLVNDSTREIAYWLYPSYARLQVKDFGDRVLASLAIEWGDLPGSTLMQLYSDLAK